MPDPSVQPRLILDSELESYAPQVRSIIQLSEGGGSSLIFNEDIHKPQRTAQQITDEAMKPGVSPEQLIELRRDLAEAEKRERKLARQSSPHT